MKKLILQQGYQQEQEILVISTTPMEVAVT